MSHLPMVLKQSLYDYVTPHYTVIYYLTTSLSHLLVFCLTLTHYYLICINPFVSGIFLLHMILYSTSLMSGHLSFFNWQSDGQFLSCISCISRALRLIPTPFGIVSFLVEVYKLILIFIFLIFGFIYSMIFLCYHIDSLILPRSNLMLLVKLFSAFYLLRRWSTN